MKLIKYSINVYQNKVELRSEMLETVGDGDKTVVLAGDKPVLFSDFKLEKFIDVSNKGAYNAEKKFVFYSLREWAIEDLRRLFIDNTTTFLFDEMKRLAEMQQMLAGINASIVRNNFKVM